MTLTLVSAVGRCAPLDNSSHVKLMLGRIHSKNPRCIQPILKRRVHLCLVFFPSHFSLFFFIPGPDVHPRAKKPVRGQFHFDASSGYCPQRQRFAGLQIPSRITHSFVFLASMGGRSAAVSSSMESAFTVLGSLSGLIRYLAASCISSRYWCYVCNSYWSLEFPC
jgi:hypothetical protein